MKNVSWRQVKMLQTAGVNVRHCQQHLFKDGNVFGLE